MACWSSDGVLAWPAGRPREYQHSLLVVPAQLSVLPKRHTHDVNDSWNTFVQVEVVKCQVFVTDNSAFHHEIQAILDRTRHAEQLGFDSGQGG